MKHVTHGEMVKVAMEQGCKTVSDFAIFLKDLSDGIYQAQH